MANTTQPTGSASPASESPLLSVLPPELRTIILSLVLVRNTPIEVTPHGFRPPYDTRLAILYTNRAISEDAKLILYQLNSFRFLDYADLCFFTQRIGLANVQRLASIEVLECWVPGRATLAIQSIQAALDRKFRQLIIPDIDWFLGRGGVIGQSLQPVPTAAAFMLEFSPLYDAIRTRLTQDAMFHAVKFKDHHLDVRVNHSFMYQPEYRSQFLHALHALLTERVV